MDFKQAVRVMLANKGLTQRDLANKIGLSEANMSRLLCKDDFRLDADIIHISQALGYTVKIQMIDNNTGLTITLD